MARIAGNAHLKIDGRNYTVSVEDGFQIKIQDVKRETKMGSDGTVHYSEMSVPSTGGNEILNDLIKDVI